MTILNLLFYFTFLITEWELHGYIMNYYSIQTLFLPIFKIDFEKLPDNIYVMFLHILVQLIELNLMKQMHSFDSSNSFLLEECGSKGYKIKIVRLKNRKLKNNWDK